MPLMTRKPEGLESLSPHEKELLIYALSQAKSRGLQIDTSILNAKRGDWILDNNGYFPKNDGKFYNPCEKHFSFIADTSHFSAIFGGRGSGKTAAGAQKALKKIQEGKSGSVINPDFENFKYSTWAELREWIPWSMVVPSHRYRQRPEWEASKPFSIVFINGAKMYCKGLKDPDSARGPNQNWLWYDEGGRDERGLGWLIAIASARVGGNTQCWTTTTPKGTDHWTYTFFVEQKIPQEAIDAFKESCPNQDLLNYWFVSIHDNKENLDPAYYASLLASYPPGYLSKRELEGQFADEGGTLGDKAWFYNKILSQDKLNEEDVTGRIRYWDMAASEKKIGKSKTNDPDSTCGTLLYSNKKYPFIIADQVAEKISWNDIKTLIIKTAENDGKDVPIYIEQEPGSGGINQVKEIASMPELAGYTIKMHQPRNLGDKIMRAQPWFAKAYNGLVYMMMGDWNTEFLNQLGGFPSARHDDRIDSVSGCFAILAPVKKWRKTEFISINTKKEALSI
jgi:predicted phage terminase large subunit-like protein